MAEQNLPIIIDKIFTENYTPDAAFSALLPALGEILKCDRVFLYLRNPHTKIGKVPYCWRRDLQYPEVINSDWNKEPESLPMEDPLFAAALRTEPSIFVEDIETASPEVVNKEFEQTNFGHRALIHAHLCEKDLMWGILQPCVFGKPRVWSEFDRSTIDHLTEKLVPLVVNYVKTEQSI